MKRIILIFLATGLIFSSCENKDDNDPKIEWTYSEKLSEKDILNEGEAFKACAIDGKEMLLISLDKFMRVDENENILEERIIPTESFNGTYKCGFLTKDFYMLANYLKLPIEYKVDSLQFDFYSTTIGNTTPFSIHSSVFPNSETIGYQVGHYDASYSYESVAINSKNQLGIVLTSYLRKDPNDRSGVHHLAIIDLDIAENKITPTFNKLITLNDFPWNRDYYSLKTIGEDFFLTTNDYGTYLIKSTGDIYNYDYNKAILEYNDTIFQFANKTVLYSVDGQNWKSFKSISEDFVYEIKVIGNRAIDYSYGPYISSYSLTDFTHKDLINDGLPSGDFYFVEEFNDKIYIGAWDGGIYFIDKNDLLD